MRQRWISCPEVYARQIPQTPAGWCATCDEEREDFLYYEKADRDIIAYLYLDMPYLLSRQLLPTKDLLTEKDVQKAWRTFSLHHHPVKTGDRTTFDELQKYFDKALQCFDNRFDFYDLPHDSE